MEQSPAWRLGQESGTDAAGEHLLRHLLADGLSAGGAVARTMAEIGPDPDYKSVLRLYPPVGG